MQANSFTSPPSELLEFMYRLGQAYLACGEQTALVELYLRRIAAVSGMKSVRVVAYTTAVFIALHDGKEEHVTLSEGPAQRLRLDQVAAVYTLGQEAQAGEVTPHLGLERLNTILQMSPRFGPVGVVAGHAILTLGLAIVLMPSPSNLSAAAILGAIIGAFKVLNRDQPILSAPLSVVAAGLVSILVFLAVKCGATIDPLYALVPPLVTFLPGAMLAFGLVELAYGDMVSGASRLVSGIVQLILLAFGLAAGALLVGYKPDNLLDGPREVIVPLGTSIVGVVVFAIGVFVHYSAPRRSLPWMLLVVLTAFSVQRLAAACLSYELSGFFGMLAATPLGYLIHKRFKGPPSIVTFLASFWLLVPGVLGLVSVTRLLTHPTGMDGLLTVVFAFTSIALGTLVGESIYQWLAGRFNW